MYIQRIYLKFIFLMIIQKTQIL